MNQFCRLCLEETKPYDNLIEIFDDKENSLKMSDVLNQHFSWLEMKPNDEFSKIICISCWSIVNEFHALYIKVEAAHEEMKEKFEKSEIIKSYNSSGNDGDVYTDDDKDFGELGEVESIESVTLKEDIIESQTSQINELVKNPEEETTQKANRIRKSKTERLEVENKIREFFNLKCEECSVTFPTFLKLKVHQRSVHSYKHGFIYCCNKKINNQAKLFEHMNWHLNPDLFRCKVCQKLYSDDYGLRLHMEFHIPEKKTLECDICSKKFSRKTQLTHHLMFVHVAKDNKDHKCTECGKGFRLNSTLQNHIRGVHQNFYRHICDICAREFNSKDQYQRHRVSHLEATPKIVCECGAKLKNKMCFAAHMRRQHQESPQTCPVCGKISPNGDALRNHIRYNHQITRQYDCTVCQKSFKKELTLKEHMASHMGITLYTCPYCSKPFNSSGNMHSHKKKVHFPEWQRDRKGSANK